MITTGAASTIDRSNPDEVARLYQRVAGWGIPPKEIAVLFAGVRDTTTLRYARDWLSAASRDDGPTMVVLAGPKGVGKTIAAAWAMFHAEPHLPYGAKWKTEQSPRFRHVSELAEIGLYEKDANKAERAAMKTTKCLVIDDVGVEIATDHFLALFDSIMNARYGSMGYTIITTNLTADQFGNRYGERVVDRIRGRGDWFDIDEVSMRGTP